MEVEKETRRNAIERLLQGQRIQIIERPAAETFALVYSSESARDGFHCFSYLQPLDRKDAFLSHVAWDLRNDDFGPRLDYTEHTVAGDRERQVSYTRSGNDLEAEALVRVRFYWGGHPKNIEIAEEFRLFWNLFYDQARQVLLHSDKDGTEHTVARIVGSRVEMQLKFLTDFLRAKQMDLALQYEGNYWSKHALNELGLSRVQREHNGDLFRWWLGVNDKPGDDEFKSISRLLGKAVVRCPGERRYNDPYATRDTTHPAFIIEIDETGQEITDAWDAARTQDNAFTLVFFRRAVLRKYFAEPERYEVADGDLRCPGFWDLRMDNDHPEYVIAWLRDLGQGLPTAEREHWRSYNILPDGGPSETFYTRNVRGWFHDPKMPDLRLKMLYGPTNEAWSKHYGWPLWCEPKGQDQYVSRLLHVCLDENQAEFDQQNGLLGKMMVDFLNVDQITKALKVKDPPDGSLNRLQLFFTDAGCKDANQQIEPLRIIYNLRSAGAAHPKGEKYAAAIKRGDLEKLPLVDASMKVFQGAVNFIDWVRSDVLTIKESGPPPLQR
jgi:hypothetical protein